MPSPRAAERRAYALVAVTPAMFATNMLIARATADSIPPFALAFWRWLAAFALVALVVGRPLWTQRRALAAEWRDLAALGALGMGVCGAILYVGARTTTATNIGLIYAASPVLIILLGRRVWGETMSRRQAAGVATCLAGVVVVAARGDPATLAALRFAAGDLWIVACAVAWAVYALLLRHRPSRVAPQVRFAAIVLAGVVVLLPFTLVETVLVGPPALDARTLGAVALLALIPSFGAYQAYDVIQRALGPARAALLMYLIPVYNAGLAWALLGELLEPYHLAGAALVLPGLWLATSRG
jgi:drug/metabolite transporter (DMT)-like permease